LIQSHTLQQTFQKLHFILTSQQFKEDVIFNYQSSSKKFTVDEVFIREAGVKDLAAVVNLRINVFYPEVYNLVFEQYNLFHSFH
jgi:hypothetical protein